MILSHLSSEGGKELHMEEKGGRRKNEEGRKEEKEEDREHSFT